MRIIWHLFEYLIIRCAACLLSALPLPWLTRLAQGIGRTLYFILPTRRRIALENIDRAFGQRMTAKEKRRVALKSFENMVLSVMELTAAGRLIRERDKRFRVIGWENMADARSPQQGVIGATAHFGAWEILSIIPLLEKRPWATIVKAQRNPYLDRMLNSLREEMGVEPIPKDAAIKRILTVLRENHALAVLIDQWDGANGLWADFFGTPTSTTSLPARLAKKRKSPVFLFYCLRKNPGEYEIHIDPVIKLEGTEEMRESAMTRELNRQLENLIRKYPEQWLWAHRRWKSKPTGED